MRADSVKVGTHAAQQVDISLKEMFITLDISFNVGWVAFWLFIIWSMVRYQVVGNFVLQMLQNGDGSGQHEDANRTIMFIGALILLWTFVNTILLGMGFGLDTNWYYFAVGSQIALFLGLLGLKKFT